jgi:hypothetical protein
MTVHEILRLAIGAKRCVRLRVWGAQRRVCPHALGFKNGRPWLLAFQYAGASISGLALCGQWRAFFIHDIQDAGIIDGGWQSGPNFIAKVEAHLGRVEYTAHH